MAGEAAAEALWRFSLMIYSRPGVADALIRLQDRDGHNVNLILYGLWLGLFAGQPLDAAELARAKAAIAGLDREVVAPLRQLRRALKADPDPDVQALRRRVLALEIAAERRILVRLAAGAPRRKERSADRQALTEANLRLILGDGTASEEAGILRRVVAAT